MTTKAAGKDYEKLFVDPAECFGTLYEADNVECEKCVEFKICGSWFTAKGNPEAVAGDAVAPEVSPPTPPPVAKTAKKAALPKKLAPAAKATPEPKKAADAKTGTGEKKEVAPTKSVQEKDEHGFLKGSRSSRIYSLLLEGKHTKEQIIQTVTKEFHSTIDKTKTTVGVFISDVQKAKGKYSASRGVTVQKDAKDVLSIK